jgi:two-component system, NarL family, competent response regulator ComA
MISTFRLHMPGLNGLDLTAEIIKEYPNAIVIIYTGYEISTHFNFMDKGGVSGFYSKN